MKSAMEDDHAEHSISIGMCNGSRVRNFVAGANNVTHRHALKPLLNVDAASHIIPEEPRSTDAECLEE